MFFFGLTLEDQLERLVSARCRHDSAYVQSELDIGYERTNQGRSQGTSKRISMSMARRLNTVLLTIRSNPIHLNNPTTITQITTTRITRILFLTRATRMEQVNPARRPGAKNDPTAVIRTGVLDFSRAKPLRDVKVLVLTSCYMFVELGVGSVFSQPWLCLLMPAPHAERRRRNCFEASCLLVFLVRSSHYQERHTDTTEVKSWAGFFQRTFCSLGYPPI